MNLIHALLESDCGSTLRANYLQHGARLITVERHQYGGSPLPSGKWHEYTVGVMALHSDNSPYGKPEVHRYDDVKATIIGLHERFGIPLSSQAWQPVDTSRMPYIEAMGSGPYGRYTDLTILP